jgi:uncharacterized membrane protein
MRWPELPVIVEVLAWAIYLLASWRVLRGTKPWPAGGAQQHLWLAGIAMLALLWWLAVRRGLQLPVGLAGSALFALIFGRAAAWAGLSIAAALFVFMAGARLASFGLIALLLAVAPTVLALALQGLIARRLPTNPFVFIVGNGMFVTFLVAAPIAVLLVALSTLADADAANNLADRMSYALLLAWGEALAAGMLFSALVVFCPSWVTTWREPPRG